MWGCCVYILICTCTKTPGRRTCLIFSKISFCSTSQVTVRSKYRINGLPNLGENRSFRRFVDSICNSYTALSIKAPASLLSSTGSVAHQQDDLLSLPAVLIGTLRWCCRLLYLRGHPVIICPILQVVLIEIGMWASWNAHRKSSSWGGNPHAPLWSVSKNQSNMLLYLPKNETFCLFLSTHYTETKSE